MDELEYIVKDALMVCDKGSVPGFFRPTYNTIFRISGCLVATEMDKEPIVNIPSFGICSVTQKPCTQFLFNLKWQNTYQVKVRNAETLLGRSYILCPSGGKIEFVTSGQVPLPSEALEDIQTMQTEGAKNEDGGGLNGWDAVELIPVIGSVVGGVREGKKGNWGMVAMNVGFLGLDVAGIFTAGTTTAASTGAKAAVKTGVKVAATSAAKATAKQVGKSGLTTGIKLSAKGELTIFKNSIDDIMRVASEGKTLVYACFSAGTPVHTEFGIKNIEDVQVGDRVWAYDKDTNMLGLQPVVNTIAMTVK